MRKAPMEWFRNLGFLAKIAVIFLGASVIVAIVGFVVGNNGLAMTSLGLGALVGVSLLTNKPSETGFTGDDGWGGDCD